MHQARGSYEAPGLFRLALKLIPQEVTHPFASEYIEGRT